MKDIKTMTPDEQARYMSSGRLTTGTITQIENGQFVTYWVARTRGYVVSMDDNWKHKTKEAAREYGRKCLSYYESKVTK